MENKETITLSVDTRQGQQSLKDLRKEINQGRNAMLEIEEGTEEWEQTLRKTAEAQHRLNEVNRLVRSSAMDLGQVLQNSTRVIGGVMGGMNAMRAVTALTGSDNEALAETFVRLQAGMAIVQGINGIDGMIKGFQNLGLLLKSTAIGTKALITVKKIWNAVMAVNPIFLLVTALAAAALGITALITVMRRNNAEQEESNRLLAEGIKLREETQYLNDVELRYLKAKGASEREIYKEKLKQLELEQAMVQMEIFRFEAKRKLNKEEKKELESLRSEYDKLAISITKTQDDEIIRRRAERTREQQDAERELERQRKQAAAEQRKRNAEAEAEHQAELKRQEELKQLQQQRLIRDEMAFLELEVLRNKNFENEQLMLQKSKELALENEELTQNERYVVIEKYEQQVNELRLSYGLYTQQELVQQEVERLEKIAEEERIQAEKLFLQSQELAVANEELKWTEQRERMLLRFEEELELLEKHGLDTLALRTNFEHQLTENIRAEEEERRNIQRETFKQTQGLYNQIDNIVMSSYQAAINQAEGNEKKQEALRKKAFEANKKFEIANTIISGLNGVINALSAKSLIPEPVGSILKAANAVAIGASTAATVASISSQQYQSSGSGSASAASVLSSQAPQVPTFTAPELSDPELFSPQQQTQDTMKVYVTEHDISDEQQKVSVITNEAIIG